MDNHKADIRAREQIRIAPSIGLSEAESSSGNPLKNVVNCLLESSSQQRKVGSLARKRYQGGSLILRGKREKVWVGRWLDDEIQPDGSIHRRHKSEVLGTLKDFSTKRLAQRELDRRLAVVNSPVYRARPTARFNEMTDRWKAKVMPNHEVSTQRSEKSDLTAWVAAIGDVSMKDISTELLQTVVTSWNGKRNPKTIRNRVGTFRLLWDSAKAWGYVAHTPYEGLVLPNWTPDEQPSFTVDEVKKIIAVAKPPYDVVF